MPQAASADLVPMRERILAVATQMLADRGYDGTSLKMIADEVGLKKPSLLHHFPSKDALRQAVLEDLFIGWAEVLPQILQQTADGQDRFTLTMDATMNYFGQSRHRARLIVREILDNPDGLSARLNASLAPWLKGFTASLSKGKRVGVVHADLDPEAYVAHTAALALSSFALAEAARGLLGDAGLNQQRLHDECLRMTSAALFI
jgi:TetR/AcrR family transcriptional regulator